MKKEHKTKPKKHHHERDRIVKWKYAQVGLLLLKEDSLVAYVCINYLNSKDERDSFRRFKKNLDDEINIRFRLNVHSDFLIYPIAEWIT